jgi:nicotinamidase-related amidase
MLKPENIILAIIDVQEKLAKHMYGREALFVSLQKLIKGARVLEIPILWLEQNPDGLGPTIPEVAALLSGLQPIAKRCFSGCGSDRFVQELRASSRKQVLLAGIETHVCVYQTACDLAASGYQVEVVSDAVSSRTVENKEIGLHKIQQVGAGLTSVETVLFELVRVAEGPAFKEILAIVK